MRASVKDGGKHGEAARFRQKVIQITRIAILNVAGGVLLEPLAGDALEVTLERFAVFDVGDFRSQQVAAH